MLVLIKVPCQVLCLGSKHARGKRLLFYKAAACGLSKCMLYSPSRWLTYRALAKSLPCLLCPGKHSGRLLSGLNHLSLYYSPQTQRAAEGTGKTSPTCAPTLLWSEVLQGSTWQNPALKMKQWIPVVHNAAGHADRWVWITHQCSDQVSTSWSDQTCKFTPLLETRVCTSTAYLKLTTNTSPAPLF